MDLESNFVFMVVNAEWPRVSFFVQWPREGYPRRLHLDLHRPRGPSDMQGIGKDTAPRWPRTIRFCCRLKIVTVKSVDM